MRVGFAPWRRVEPVEVTRTDAGSSSHLRMTYVLRCLKQPCVPEREILPFEFEPAQVEFTNREGGRGALRASFPTVTVHTRIQAGDLATVAPWRLDVTDVPEPSYRMSPALLLALLIGGSLVLLVGGGALAYAGWPRRVVEPEPEPEPEPELLPTPLEQALELLEDAQRANGAADQRRSLELVAEVLAERGEEDGLAEAARELAWSPTRAGGRRRRRASRRACAPRSRRSCASSRRSGCARKSERRRRSGGGPCSHAVDARRSTHTTPARFRASGRRALALRVLFAGGAIVLLDGGGCSRARDLDPRDRGLLPTGTTGRRRARPLALDPRRLSPASSGGRCSRSSTPMRPVGLVVFSDVAYELLPPGTPPRAS